MMSVGVQAVYDAVREAGGVCIADEVQVSRQTTGACAAWRRHAQACSIRKVLT